MKKSSEVVRQKYLNLLTAMSNQSGFRMTDFLRKWKVSSRAGRVLKEMGYVVTVKRISKWVKPKPSIADVDAFIANVRACLDDPKNYKPIVAAAPKGNGLVPVSEEAAIEVLRRSAKYDYSITRTLKAQEAEVVL